MRLVTESSDEEFDFILLRHGRVILMAFERSLLCVTQVNLSFDFYQSTQIFPGLLVSHFFKFSFGFEISYQSNNTQKQKGDSGGALNE